MQTIDNTARIVEGAGVRIELDNGWGVFLTYRAAIVLRPVLDDSTPANKRIEDTIVAIFDSAELAVAWAASGGTADSTNGVKVKPR